MKDSGIEMYEQLNGKHVQVNDRFETVHIWSKELAIKNANRFVPKEISKEKFESEKRYSWNN